jgi:hypothetical protein
VALFKRVSAQEEEESGAFFDIFARPSAPCQRCVTHLRAFAGRIVGTFGTSARFRLAGAIRSDIGTGEAKKLLMPFGYRSPTISAPE